MHRFEAELLQSSNYVDSQKNVVIIPHSNKIISTQLRIIKRSKFEISTKINYLGFTE